MRLLIVTIACLVSVEVLGHRVQRDYRCRKLPDGTAECTTTGGDVHQLPRGVDLSGLGDRLVETLPTIPSQSTTEPETSNRTSRISGVKVPRRLNSRSTPTFPFNLLENATLERNALINFTESFSSNSTEFKGPRSRAVEFSSEFPPLASNRTPVATSPPPDLLVQSGAHHNKSGINKLRLQVPSVVVTSEVLIVPLVMQSTTLPPDHTVHLPLNATSLPRELGTSETPEVEGRDAAGIKEQEHDGVDIRSSLPWCCCEEVLSTRNTQVLLRERGVTANIQRARPHALSLASCRKRSCEPSHSSSAARCVQKYRNATVTIDVDNERRSRLLVLLDDGCECRSDANRETRPTSGVSTVDLQSSAVNRRPGQSPGDVDSSFGNIADMISDGVVKLASVSKKMFSLNGITTNANDTRALANVLDETAGLIERAADQLLHLNSAVANLSPSQRQQLPFQVIPTKTVTIVTCLQSVSVVQPATRIRHTGSTTSFSSQVLLDVLSASGLSSPSTAEPQPANPGTSAVPSTSFVSSWNFGFPAIPTSDFSTTTISTSEEAVTFIPSSHSSRVALDLKTEIYSSILLSSSNLWLPKPESEKNTSPSRTSTLNPTALLQEQVTVVTRVTRFVVINGTTFTYAANDPSTSVEGNDGPFATSPQFQPQTNIRVSNSITLITITTWVAPSPTSRFTKTEFTKSTQLGHSTVIEPTAYKGSTIPPTTLSSSVLFPTSDSGVVPSASGVWVFPTEIPGSSETRTVEPSDSKTILEPGLHPEGSPPLDVSNENVFIDPLISSQNSSLDTFNNLGNTSINEDKLLDIVKSLVMLQKKMKECLANETAETKAISLPHRDFLAQPLKQQAILMPIWREFAASNILNDLDEDTLGRCSRDLNATAPLSLVPRYISEGIKSLHKVSGLLMAVMELSHCTNLQLACSSLLGRRLQRRLAAAQLIGTILTESRRSELNLGTLVDLVFVDLRNSSRLSPDMLQTSLISKTSLIREFENALLWSKSESEDTGYLSMKDLGTVLAYSAKLEPLLNKYTDSCAVDLAGTATASHTDLPSIVAQSSTKVEPFAQTNSLPSTTSSTAIQVPGHLPQSPSSLPSKPQRLATFVPFAQLFTDLPQYHPIRLSRDEVEQLIFP